MCVFAVSRAGHRGKPDLSFILYSFCCTPLCPLLVSSHFSLCFCFPSLHSSPLIFLFSYLFSLHSSASCFLTFFSLFSFPPSFLTTELSSMSPLLPFTIIPRFHSFSLDVFLLFTLTYLHKLSSIFFLIGPHCCNEKMISDQWKQWLLENCWLCLLFGSQFCPWLLARHYNATWVMMFI